MSESATEIVTRDGQVAPRIRWFLVNFGILYGITFIAGGVFLLAGSAVSGSAPSGWAWLYGLPLSGLVVVGFTATVTLPSFTVYLVGLRLAQRRWPRRATAWILTPLFTPLLAWMFLLIWDSGGGDWWAFATALACVAAAAALVRV